MRARLGSLEKFKKELLKNKNACSACHRILHKLGKKAYTSANVRKYKQMKESYKTVY